MRANDGITFTVTPTSLEDVYPALVGGPRRWSVLQTPRAHEWLPFTYMAQAMRQTLDAPPGGVPLLPFVVLSVWAVVGLSVTCRVMTRRG